MARKKSPDECAPTESGILDFPYPSKCTAESDTGNKIYELERDLESAVVRFARGRLWYTRKYRTAGRRAAPDRIFIRGGKVLFIEFKRLGNVPTKQQRDEIGLLLAVGADVVWVDSYEDACAVLKDRENRS